MGSYIKFMDGLPVWAKFILALPAFHILWAIYRIAKGIKKNNIVLLIVGILWIFIGIVATIIDLVTIVLHGRVTVLAD